MWVESQDGEWLVNLNRTNTLSTLEMANGIGYVYADETTLGIYGKYAVAKRVLKYLKDEIANHQHDTNYVCRMPKGTDAEAEEDKDVKEERIYDG